MKTMLSAKGLARFTYLVALILLAGIEAEGLPTSTSGDQAAAAVAVATAQANSNSSQNVSNPASMTTIAPIALNPSSEPPKTTPKPTIASDSDTVKVSNHSSHSSSTALPALIASHSTTTGPTNAAEPSQATTQSPQMSMLANGTLASTGIAANHTAKPIIVDPIDERRNNETTFRFSDYLKPICNSTDKIQPKQMFRIQTQFKQFVELTNGKLGLCLMENYMFDPVLKPVTKAQLIAICTSKKVPSTLRGSYGLFEDCAAKNWEPALDKELDKINEARLNCAKNHDHSKSNSTISVSEGLAHEEEDYSLISQMVSEVLEGGKDGQANKDLGIQVIDIGVSSTSKPSGLHPLAKHSGRSTNETFNSKINDPKTVVVLMDENNKTTSAPTPANSSTGKHLLDLLTTTTAAPILSPSTTPKSHLVHSAPTPAADHLLAENNTTPAPTTGKPSSGTLEIELGTQEEANKGTVAPKLPSAETSTTTTIPITTLKPTTTSNPSTVEPSNETLKTTPTPSNLSPKTTKKFDSLLKSTKAPTAMATVTASVNSASLKRQTSEKPAETLDQVLARQEKEKEEFEKRLRIERERALKQLEKKQHEGRGHQGADNRLHQLEHERQMSMDPIGHTIKHQQYEANKQQKMLGRK